MHPTHNPPTTAGADTPAQVLRDAALYLERHGWTRGAFYDYLNGLHRMPAACAVGAIRVVCFGTPVDDATDLDDLADEPPRAQVFDAIRVLAQRLAGPHVAHGVENFVVTDWNDRAITIGQVVTVLRDAADHWDYTTHGGAA
ncbi:DUF6197 family protein [Planosporangium mesophilum]|nr:hypothetical protein [Planosporangium mesophilum]NJC85149.1 hypothetical protein [Planosporangium mesophilum]